MTKHTIQVGQDIRAERRAAAQQFQSALTALGT